MAMLNGKEGVWRTIGGRRIFIADGEDLKTAMRKSGKFKILNDNPIDNFNNELKTIKTFEQLKNLEKEVYESNDGLLFRTKRAKWQAYDFTKVDDNKVRYLLSNGVSIRIQLIKDLYKYIEIADRAR